MQRFLLGARGVSEEIIKNSVRYSSTLSTNLSKFDGMTGGQCVYKKFLENDVKDVFLYSGGAIMPVVDAFYNGPINYYINTHEQNCGHAATGYAKSSGRTGVCVVTSGPGLTNMITPMLDAQNDSTPMVVLSGQVPLSAMGSNAFQECPATELTKPVTKWNYCVQNTEEIPEVIDWAFKIANDGKPGVVHLDLPKCVTASLFDIKKYKKNDFDALEFILANHHDDNLNPEYIQKISDVINKSKNPILYLGKGVNHCPNLVNELATKSNIPVTTTVHGMGAFDEDHDKLALKFLGMHGSATANYAIQNSDCIIAIGSRFDDRTTGAISKYAPKAIEAGKEGKGGIIHCNIENSEIGKVVKANYNVHADSEKFITELLKYVKYNPRKDWFKQLKKWKKGHKFTYDSAPDNKIKTQDVIKAINSKLHESFNEFIVSTGVGNHQMMAAQFINWRKPNTFLTSGSLGVMGAGLPYATGAQIANPDTLVIDIDGDSSFNHTLSDLKTISEHNLPVKIAIMNDGHQSMVRVWEKLFYDNRITATTLERNPNYGELAEAFGIESLSCDNIHDLESVVELFLNYKGPILCDFKVVTDYCFPLVAPGKGLDEMILHSPNGKRDNMDFDRSLPPS